MYAACSCEPLEAPALADAEDLLEAAELLATGQG